MCCKSISKMFAGAGYGKTAYIYQPTSFADMELNTPQCLLMSLLNSLFEEDVMSCYILADLCYQVQQLQSDYLSIWLIGEFVFPRQDMVKAMVLLSKLLANGALRLPPHVIRIMSLIVTKYGIQGVQLASSVEGVGDPVNRPANSATDSPGDNIASATEGGDINGSTQSGVSLLHLAVSAGRFVDADVVNSINTATIEEAVKNNHLCTAAAGHHNGELEALLGAEMEMDDKNHLDEKPLVTAVTASNTPGVELLAKEADVNIPQEGGKSLLEIAVETKNVNMFKEFVKRGVLQHTKFKDGDTIVHVVARSGCTEMLQVINDQRLPANIKNKNGYTPLHIASEPSVVRLLILMGGDVNERSEMGETPLYLASAVGSLEMVRTLVQEGAAVDTQDNRGTTALMIALNNSKEDTATFLLNSGANPRIKAQDGRTPLHYAAEGGCVGSVIPLLDAGAIVDEKDNKDETPAFVAAANCKLSVLQLLVERGTELTLMDSKGDRMIHRAASRGHAEAVRLLLDAGVAVDARSKDLRTALYCAAEEGHVPVAVLLLAHDADPGAKEVDGWTPLMVAAEKGHLGVVQLLVNRGAPVNERSISRQTALYIANFNRHRSVVDYLKSRGAVK